MKMNISLSLLLLAASLMCLPSFKNNNRGNDMNKLKNKESVAIKNEQNEEFAFDFYSSADGSFIYENNELHSTSAGEQKAILKNFSSKELDISFTISGATQHSTINGGLYFHAKNARSVIDGIDAFNVQVVKDPSSPFYTISVFNFENSVFKDAISNTIKFSYVERNIKIRVTANEKELNVYLNGSNIPSLTKQLKNIDKSGLEVGFRSMFAEQTFSNIVVSDKIKMDYVPTVKVLMVGNSYAQDTMTYCHEIAASQGVNMVCGVIFYGGCTVEQHSQFIEKNSNVYTYFKNGGTDKNNANFDEILLDEDWDYITIQTGTGNQGLKDTYYPYIQKIIAHIENLVPKAEVGLFQSWYVPQCFEGKGNSRLSKYNDSSTLMYQETNRVTKEVQLEMGLEFIVGSNEMLHRISLTDICDESALETCFNRDSVGHMNEKGRYMMGMLMFRTITGYSFDKADYLPFGRSYDEETEGVNQEIINIIKPVVLGMIDEFSLVNHFEKHVDVVNLEVNEYQREYNAGEYFNYQHAIVNVVYSNGQKENTKNFVINIMRPLTQLDNEIVISYKGKSIDLPIHVY